jgi:C-terminal processing protease CtpA/Prc
VRGVPYRLPTVLADGAPAFLVGVLGGARELGAAPVAMLTTDAGPRPLPLHPLRTGTGAPEPWSLTEDGEVPVLRVSTMDADRLEGLAATAVALRDRDEVVLDLRGNGGGGDQPAHELIGALTAEPLRVAAAVDLRPGPGERMPRTQATAVAQIPGVASETWRGRLWVLTDGGVASSGETMTWLAAQLPGAVVVGGNTAGCTSFGNLVNQRPLPHSRLRATFGHTRFVWDAVHPAIEGTGRFPDLWLDEPDPIAFLSALPAIVAP